MPEAKRTVEAEIEKELSRRLQEEEKERLRLDDQAKAWVLNGSQELKRAVIFEIKGGAEKVEAIPEDSLNLELR